MSDAPLAILGIGTYLPPAEPVREWAAARGAEVSAYRGWPMACHAGPDDHPSSMGATALGAALAKSGVAPDDLRLVIFTGSSRDYVPSWSVASEIMRLCGASERCTGLDMTAGCVATLAAVDLAHGWLTAHGGGHAAVVCAERWSHTIDVADASTMTLWAYGDSGAAVVVGLDTEQAAVARFRGAEFTSAADNNGHVFIPYGGTRQPEAPPGVNPFRRHVSDRPKQVITDSYRRAFGRVLTRLRERFGIEPTRLVCNQTSPALVAMIGEVSGLSDRAVLTGLETGHCGGTDILIGLDRLAGGGELDGPTVVFASTAFGFGAGLVTAP